MLYKLIVSLIIIFPFNAYASLQQDDIMRMLNEDIERPFSSTLYLRQCIDGQQAQNFDGEIIEYWVNLNCSWCAIEPVIKAQAAHPNWCIVVRHAADPEMPTSLQKSLIYESLKQQSVGASILFWENVYKKHSQLTDKEIHDLNLMLATKLNLDFKKLSDDMINVSALIVTNDIEVAKMSILRTPTYVVSGLRLTGCDFVQEDLDKIVELALKVRRGDEEAKKYCSIGL